MGSTLRIKFAICLTLFLLSGCSLFDDSVENCEEPQEYQDSLSMPPLIVPEYLRDTQNRSIFNIPNTQGINASNQQSFSLQKTPNKSMPMTKESNQINNIESEELSELLQLIDQTISNRQLDRQFQPIYESVTIGSLSDSSLDPCLDGPPQYFSEKISPRSMPTQTYIQPSKVSETGEEEKSRRQIRREKRQEKNPSKPRQEETGEDASSKESEEQVEPKGDTVDKIFKVLAETVLGVFTGSRVQNTTINVGKSLVPPKPIRPDDGEIIDEIDQNNSEEPVSAEQIRNLAVLDPTLNDEQRSFIKNMSDKQILEMAAAIMKERESEDIVSQSTSENKISERTPPPKAEEDDWFTRVKDQWTEGKAQREARRGARQERRSKRQSQDD